MKQEQERRKRVNKQWTNTHFYDRNVSKNALRRIEPVVRLSRNLIKEEKLVCLNDLRTKLEINNLRDNGIVYYDRMVQSYIKDDSKNYDPVNNLDPIDLLYVVFLISNDNEEILSILSEQLNDMKTGFCPQGRSIRLIQIIDAFL